MTASLRPTSPLSGFGVGGLEVGGQVGDEAEEDAEEVAAVVGGPVGEGLAEPAEHAAEEAVGNSGAGVRRLDQAGAAVGVISDPARQPSLFQLVQMPGDMRPSDLHPVGDLTDAQGFPSLAQGQQD